MLRVQKQSQGWQARGERDSNYVAAAHNGCTFNTPVWSKRSFLSPLRPDHRRSRSLPRDAEESIKCHGFTGVGAKKPVTYVSVSGGVEQTRPSIFFRGYQGWHLWLMMSQHAFHYGEPGLLNRSAFCWISWFFKIIHLLKSDLLLGCVSNPSIRMLYVTGCQLAGQQFRAALNANNKAQRSV